MIISSVIDSQLIGYFSGTKIGVVVNAVFDEQTEVQISFSTIRTSSGATLLFVPHAGVNIIVFF